MKLEYLENTGDPIFSHLIRLYDFDSLETLKLIEAISSSLIEQESNVKLHKMDFVRAMNCELILELSLNSNGAVQKSSKSFVCEMKKEGYQEMKMMLIDSLNSNGFYWLDHDSKSEIPLLYSHGGGW